MKEQIAHENTRAQRASHPFRLRIYALKPRLAVGNLLLHVRFIMGSKKGRTDIILGCFGAHIEPMLKPRQRDPPAG